MQNIINDIIRQSNQPKQQFPISDKQYQDWVKQSVFDQLCGQRLGQSFCNNFDIHDNILFYCLTEDETLSYIETNYINNKF